jgi:ferredoxin
VNIRLEATVCEGFGTCAGHAPDLFELDEWGYAIAKGDGSVPPDQEAFAQRAAMDCPVHAIVLTD